MNKIKGVDTSTSSTRTTTSASSIPPVKDETPKSSRDVEHRPLNPCGIGGTKEIEEPIGFDEVDVPNASVTTDTPVTFSTAEDIVKASVDNGPALHLVAEPSAFPTVVQIVNGIVTPNLRVLLASVLGTIDASIPNKDQNKAVKHIMRKAFDDAYCNILERSYPYTDFGFGGEYNLEPEPNMAKAYAAGFLKVG